MLKSVVIVVKGGEEKPNHEHIHFFGGLHQMKRNLGGNLNTKQYNILLVLFYYFVESLEDISSIISKLLFTKKKRFATVVVQLSYPLLLLFIFHSSNYSLNS